MMISSGICITVYMNDDEVPTWMMYDDCKQRKERERKRNGDWFSVGLECD
jgi:hypothetical protein